MKKSHFVIIALLVSAMALYSHPGLFTGDSRREAPPAEAPKDREISGVVRKGESLFDIFRHYGLDLQELFKLKESTAGIHRLSALSAGNAYRITTGTDNRIRSFSYWINQDSLLKITRGDTGFQAQKIVLEYEARPLYVTGTIEDNLISSIGASDQRLLLAIKLSDIFAWDIDFNTDIQKGDSYRVLVEGLFLDGEFRKFGEILAAEFVNERQTCRAYRFECGDRVDYFDENGKSLRRAFLKAPLSFRRISSGFSRKRMHPIMKIRRPHNGLDYVAPAGAPVSAMADGKVAFAGSKGGYGRLVVLKHAGSYETFYGHLSGFARGTRSGARVQQGQVIGYVGSSGMSTGPHLHFEMRKNGRAINPKKEKMERGSPVPEHLMAAFADTRNRLDVQLSRIPRPALALSGSTPG